MSSDFDIMRVFLLCPAVRPQILALALRPKRNRDFAENEHGGKAQFPGKSPIRGDLSADNRENPEKNQQAAPKSGVFLRKTAGRSPEPSHQDISIGQLAHRIIAS
jgi:hypothetical protein